MKRNRLLNRPIFFIISLSILILVIVAGWLTWHLLTQLPTPPQATCGTLTAPGGSSAQPHTQQVEDCFYRAFQHCDSMSIQVIKRGTDASSTTFYWPQKVGNGCQIITLSNSYTLTRGDTSSTETCQGVIPKDGGLLLQQCNTSGAILINQYGDFKQ